MARALHIQEEPYYGGQFPGNQFHTLINNVDLLQRMPEQDSAFRVFDFIDTFRKLQSVATACFGMTMAENFAEKGGHRLCH